jgi:hypothetical protein
MLFIKSFYFQVLYVLGAVCFLVEVLIMFSFERFSFRP